MREKDFTKVLKIKSRNQNQMNHLHQMMNKN